MKKSIELWKNAENGMNNANPVVINKEVMKNVIGGAQSAGKFCTVSAGNYRYFL